MSACVFVKLKKYINDLQENLHCAWKKFPLFTIGQKYWTLHEELQAFLYKARGQIPQCLGPFYRVPENSGFIYAQHASIEQYRDRCRHQGRDEKTVYLSDRNIFRKQS